MTTDFPLGWEIRSLSGVTEAIVDCLHSKKPNPVEVGYTCLQVFNIGDFGRLDLIEKFQISESDYITWTKRIQPRKLDLLISKTGRVGAVAQILDDTPYAYGRNLVLVRPNLSVIDPVFLRFCMLSPWFRREIQIYTSDGTVLQSLHVKYVPRLAVIIPPLPEQRAIAAILGVLDDKIELNRQMNKALEAMAQALFKSWFVDFEPFRDQGMEDSTMGPIPRGWGVAQIGNLGDVICGKTPPTRDADNYEGHIPFITIPDIHDKVFVTQTGGYLTEKGAKTQPKKLLPRHAVCVSCIATPGLVALTSQPSHTNQQINSIICNDSISPFWCYLAMINLRHEIITGGAGGSATLNLNKNEFSKLQVIKPSQVVMWKFHQIVEPLFSRILSNELENIKLADIRDSLLPKLLSGEIRGKDAEKFVEEKI